MNWQLTWTSACRVTGWYAVERRLAGQHPATDWTDDVDTAAAELKRPLGRFAWNSSKVGELLRRCMFAVSDVHPASASHSSHSSDSSDSSNLESLVSAVVRRKLAATSAESRAENLAEAPAEIQAEAQAEIPAKFPAELSDQEIRDVTVRLTVIARMFDVRLPRLPQELPLRLGPIREQWEARGIGLMRRMQRLWRDDWRVDKARVMLVHPVCGGGGVALNGSAVAFEAMLYNATPTLPEVLRLAWLLAQLPGLNEGSADHTMNDTFPVREGLAPRQRLALGLLPVVLDAGEYVELTRYDATTLLTALEVWCGYDREHAEELGRVLDAWWQTRRTARGQA